MKTKLITNIFSIILCLVLSAAFVLADSSLSIDPVNTDAEIGDQFTISVDVNSDDDVGGVQFNLEFDPSVIEVDSYVDGGFLSQGSTLTDISEVNNTEGIVEVVILRNEINGVTGQGSIVEVTFNTLSIGETNLTLSDVDVWDENVVATTISGVANGTANVTDILNFAPDMPILNLPLNGALVNTEDVVLNFTINDVDNDTMWCYIYGDNETDPTTEVYVKIDVVNGDVTHTWDNLDDGIYYWKVYCDDVEYESLNSTVFSFEVDASAPLIDALNKSPEVSYNDNDVTLSANVTDDDLNNVWMSIRKNDGNWTNSTPTAYPAEGDIYEYEIDRAYFENQDLVEWKVYADDTAGNLAESSVQDFIVENRDPVLDLNITVPAWDEDTNTTFDISSYFVDPDGDNITFDVVIPLANMGGALNETSGEVLVIPDPDFFGNDTIVFAALDVYGGSVDSNDVVLIVDNVNDAPYFTTTPSSLVAIEDVEYQYDADADDIDSNLSNLEFSIVSGPTGATFVIDEDLGDIGLFSWTPTGAQVGLNEVEIEVEDLEGDSETQEFNITVLPVLDIIDITIEGVSVEDGDSVKGIAPGDVIDVTYKVLNRFPDEANNAIVGIETSAEISAYSLQDSTSGINIEGQATQLIDYELQLPYTANVENFSVVISTEGTDLYNDDHSSSKTIDLVLDRDFHRVEMTGKEFSSGVLNCSRDTVLSINIVNTGDYSEEGTVTVYNAATDTNETQNFLMNIADESQLNFNVDASQATDDEVFDITVSYRDDYYVIEDSIELLINGCLDVASLDLKVNESEVPGWSPIDLKEYTYGDTTGLVYTLINQNDTLIDCDVSSVGIFSCLASAADLYGISTINMSIGDVNELFNVEVIEKNDAPVAYDVTDVTDEDNSVVVTLNYTDVDTDEAVSCEVGNIVGGLANDCNCASGVCSVELSPTADSNADITADYNVSDGSATSNTATITVSVNPVLDEPSIINASPDNNPLIGDNVVQDFSITIDDPDSISPAISWYVDGSLQPETSTTFSHSAVVDFIVRVEIENATTDNEHEWSVDVSTVPVTDYEGTVNDVTYLDVSNFTGLTIENPGVAKIDFGNQTIDLSDVVDVDTNVRLQKGVAGIDSDVFTVFQGHSARVTMYGLSFTETPTIYYNSGFTTSGTNVCSQCSNVEYNSTTGTLSFDVNHFSIYYVIINEPPVITSSARTDAVITEAYSYDVNADDPENDPLTYSLTTKPSGMTIDSSSGVISWTPNATGTEDVTIEVTDGDNTDTQSYQINVREKNMLIIDDLDVQVDGKSDSNLDDGDTLDDEAKPGDLIEFKIKVKNDYDDNIDIEDIEIRVTIDNIGDDDLEDESSEFDLSDGKSETITLSLRIPEEAEEDTYEIVIEVDGEDENGNEQEETWYLTLDVEREKHDVKITEASVSPSTIRCSRSISVPVELVNIGSKDEDVELTIKNSALGINKIDSFELDKDPDDDDNNYDYVYYFNVDDDVQAGTYPITVEAEYSGKRKVELLDLTVQDCSATSYVDDDEDEEEAVVRYVDEDGNYLTYTIFHRDSDTETVVTGKEAGKVSFRETSGYIALMVILFLLLAGAIIYAFSVTIYAITKKR